MKLAKYGIIGVLLTFICVVGSYAVSRMGVYNWHSHYDPLALPDLTEKPYWLTQTRLKLIDLDGKNCGLVLSRAGLNFKPAPQKGVGTSCELDDAVELTHLVKAKLKPEDTRCNIAARLYMWERNIVQPEALRQFGESVAEITHFGSYSCRTIRGSSYMSEHATGNAFDISGFKLKSGRVISILRDWDKGQSSDFLHVVHDGLCNYFNLTLSPDYNADHKDHFHVDMGWVRGCH
jgi:hypothetical protein